MIDVNKLAEVYKRGRETLRHLGEKACEQHTVDAIVVPVLNELGWSFFDGTLVKGYPIKGYRGMQEVDIALFVEGFGDVPAVLVEVKQYGTKLSDDHIRQVETYGTLVKEAKWLVCTNGAQWKILSNDRRELILEFDFDEGVDDRFELMSRDSVSSGRLQRFAFRSMAERAVEEYIARNKTELAKEIYEHYSKRYPLDEIEAVLAGLFQRKRPESFADKSRKSKAGEFPIPIYSIYHFGRYREAELLQDGTVVYEGKRYTPSGAAKAAEKSAPNGWLFWRLVENGRPIASIADRVAHPADDPPPSEYFESFFDKISPHQRRLIEMLREKLAELDPKIVVYYTKNDCVLGWKTPRGLSFLPPFAFLKKSGVKLTIILRYPFERLKGSSAGFEPKRVSGSLKWGICPLAHIASAEDVERIFPVLVNAYELLRERYG